MSDMLAGTLGNDWTISASLINQFSFGINSFHKDTYSIKEGKNWRSRVCVINAADCNVSFGNVSFTEFSAWGTAADDGTDQPRITWKDDLSIIRGPHSVRFGFTHNHQEAKGSGEQNISGLAGFGFLETAAPGCTPATSGSSFASFLLGNADTGATETIAYTQQVARYSAFCANDDRRISSKLMLNHGVRYEFTLPPVAGVDKYSDFSRTTPNSAVNNYLGELIRAGAGPGRRENAKVRVLSQLKRKRESPQDG
jgi:hypothetical protein